MKNNLKTILVIVPLIIYSGITGHCSGRARSDACDRILNKIQCQIEQGCIDPSLYSSTDVWENAPIFSSNDVLRCARLQELVSKLSSYTNYNFGITAIAVNNIYIDEEMIEYIASLRELKTLSLRGCKNSFEELVLFLNKLSSDKLIQINVTGTELEHMDDLDLGDYAFASLFVVDSTEARGLGDSISMAGRRLSKKGRNKGASEEDLDHTSSTHLSNLRAFPDDISQLNLDNNNLEGIQSRDITRFKQLKHLDLSSSTGINSQVLSSILRGLSDTLEVLYLSDLIIDDNCIECFVKFKNLKLLNMNRCTGLSGKAFGKLIRNLPDELRHLSLESTSIPDSAAGLISKFHCLEELNLSSCCKIKSETVSKILDSICDTILNLNLSDVCLRGNIIPVGKRFKKIQTLDLSSTRSLNERMLEDIIKNLPNTLRVFNLSNSNLSDSCINSLLKLNLSSLNITNCTLLSMDGVFRIHGKFLNTISGNTREITERTSDKSCGCVIL